MKLGFIPHQLYLFSKQIAGTKLVGGIPDIPNLNIQNKNCMSTKAQRFGLFY